MPQTIEGRLQGKSLRLGIVLARFNGEITEGLYSGALRCLGECGVAAENVTVLRVPGAFEIPLGARRLAESGRFDAVICLGAVIRGETEHYDHICQAAASGILQAGLATGIPVTFGVLTCSTEELAAERSGAGPGDHNKGYEAAAAAVEMATALAAVTAVVDDQRLPRPRPLGPLGPLARQAG